MWVDRCRVNVSFQEFILFVNKMLWKHFLEKPVKSESVTDSITADMICSNLEFSWNIGLSEKIDRKSDSNIKYLFLDSIFISAFISIIFGDWTC